MTIFRRRETRNTAAMHVSQRRMDDWTDDLEAGPVVARVPAPLPGNLVLPAARPTEMASMAGAVPLAALTQSPGVHTVEIRTTYTDRAEGFVRSTLPLWWVVAGSAAALVLLVWIIGPLAGKWAFALGWWIASEIGVLSVVSIAVWVTMWWKWHYDSPDAIASRSADARLRMGEKWFERELKRTYGDDK